MRVCGGIPWLSRLSTIGTDMSTCMASRLSEMVLINVSTKTSVSPTVGDMRVTSNTVKNNQDVSSTISQWQNVLLLRYSALGVMTRANERECIHLVQMMRYMDRSNANAF